MNRQEPESPTELILDSRLRAIEGLHGGLQTPPRPVLLTGEAGAGKSWVAARARSQDPIAARWLMLDLAPEMTARDLAETISNRLGLDHPGRSSLAHTKLQVEAALEDLHAEEHLIGVVVEQIHLATFEVLESLRAIAERLGTPAGFDALWLIGQTAARRKLSGRAAASLDALIDDRIHLGPIDADEATLLAEALWPGGLWSESRVECLHRDAMGNPRRFLALARRAHESSLASKASRREPSPKSPTLASRPVADAPLPRFETSDTAPERDRPWIPSKPVSQSGENVIEVGWDLAAEESDETPAPIWLVPEHETRLSRTEPTAHPMPRPTPQARSIDDPYAQLQAAIESEGHVETYSANEHEAEIFASDPQDDAESLDSSLIWPDSPHPFEPYGELFAGRHSANGSPLE